MIFTKIPYYRSAKLFLKKAKCKSNLDLMMAQAVEIVETKRNRWTVETNVRNILGKGAYGIVYKAHGPDGNEMAAKAINEKYSKIVGQDFEKLLDLTHDNLVKIFDVHQQENNMWLFMDLCSFGDLNDFCKSKVITMGLKMEMMVQISKGVEYLHSNNVIHRDIKPGNILVSSESPFLLKLTDFDVSKCLDPDVETSVMSSNVGTLCFKAPEFFQRNIQGKISYHRNVDVYACGLTFLALLQADPEKQMLIPRIETAKDYSERHLPIGQLIAERIKYNVQELDIVVVNFEQSDFRIIEIKELIRKMTNVKPDQRLTARGVITWIQAIVNGEEGIEFPTFASGITDDTDIITQVPVQETDGIVDTHTYSQPTILPNITHDTYPVQESMVLNGSAGILDAYPNSTEYADPLGAVPLMVCKLAMMYFFAKEKKNLELKVLKY